MAVNIDSAMFTSAS